MTPSTNNKRIAKNTMMLYIRMLFTMLVSLYTSRVVLDVLGVEDYGIYNVVGGVVSMFSFLNVALSTANSRFLAFEIGKKDQIQLKKVFRTAFTIHVIIAVVILILLETIGLWFVNHKLVIPPERLVAANLVFQLSILSALISVLQVPITSLIIANERMTIYAYLGIVRVSLKLIIVLLLTKASSDKLITYGALLLILNLLIFTIYSVYSKRKFQECSLSLLYDKDLFKEMLSYSGWSFIGSFANIMKLQGNNMLLNIFFGPTVNAARGIAYQVNFAVNGFAQNFTTAMKPQIIKNYAKNDIDTMMNLLFRGAKFSYFLLLLFGLPILMETPFILDIWLVDVPNYAVIFTQLVIINSLIDSFSYVIGTAIQATGKIKWYQVFVGGFLLLNIPVSYLFLKNGFQPQVTLFVSITLAVLVIGVRLLLVKKHIPQFNVKSFAYIVYAIGAIVTFISIIPPLILKQYLDPGLIRFIIISIATVVSSLASIWIIGLTKNERSFIKESIRDLIKKFRK